MKYLIEIIKIVLLKFFSILPDSPFSNMFSDLDTGFMTYLNWFLPLDNCVLIIGIWIDCMIGYYIFVMVWRISKAIFLKLITEFEFWEAFFFGLGV